MVATVRGRGSFRDAALAWGTEEQASDTEKRYETVALDARLGLFGAGMDADAF